ncbi:MAG: enoyl-CoA hydratase/isomerase family protein [Burkholderiaceae bacterium]
MDQDVRTGAAPEVRTLRKSTLTVDGPVACLEMTDVASRNAISQEMKDDLQEVVRLASAGDAWRALVITGSPGVFCAGGDLKDLTSRRHADGTPVRDVEGIRRRMSRSHAWFERLYNLEIPVIAAVDGPAFGAGFSLALACDFIVASSRARFCMAFNRIGALPDLAALYTLPRMIGLRRAKDIMMTARVVSVEEAKELGIVHSIHAPQAVREEAMAMARTFALGSAQSLAMTKVFSNQSLESDYATMARLEGVGQATCLNSDYFFEAVARFMDRQPPRFDWKH